MSALLREPAAAFARFFRLDVPSVAEAVPANLLDGHAVRFHFRIAQAQPMSSMGTEPACTAIYVPFL